MVPFFEKLAGGRDSLKDNFGVRVEPWPLFILGAVLLLVSYVFMPSVVSLALSIAFFLAPVWLPFLLIDGAVKLWYNLARSETIASRKYILLEIKPPRDLVKTPLAMEAFLSTLHLSGGESNWWALLKGGTRPTFSLEIASLEGQVHFFIWSQATFRRMIEGQLYAQYPGVQVVEAPDYTRMISGKPEEWSIWGCDFKHTAPDPLPIKTYIEYGLDKVQKEPEQVDPLANLIEFMGSIGKGEYLWLQFVIRFHKGEKYHETVQEGKKSRPYTWIDEGKKLVDEIRKATRDTYIDQATGKEMPGFPNPTKGQAEKMAAIERNTSKIAFDVGARSIYLVKPEKFNVVMIFHMIALFKPFSTEGWNGINSNAWMKTFDDYPWEIGTEKVKDRYRRKLVEAFRRRQFFYDPFAYGIPVDKAMVMSTEELATVFHIPSRSVETPGLGRVQSATGEAPPNLPT